MACKGDMTLKTEHGDITLQSGRHITQIAEHHWDVMYGGNGYITAANDVNGYITAARDDFDAMTGRGDMTFRTEHGDITLQSREHMTLKTEHGDITLQSGRHMTQIAEQNWSVTYGGNGFSTASNGGTLTLKGEGFEIIE